MEVVRALNQIRKLMSYHGLSSKRRIKWSFYHNMSLSYIVSDFCTITNCIAQCDMEIHSIYLNRFSFLFVYLFICDMTMFPRTLNKRFRHFQLKELLSFGFNYKFNENQTCLIHRYALFLIDKRQRRCYEKKPYHNVVSF